MNIHHTSNVNYSTTTTTTNHNNNNNDDNDNNNTDNTNNIENRAARPTPKGDPYMGPQEMATLELPST